jgi:hypothetical protein
MSSKIFQWDAFLVTDFINLKIKLTWFFECAHRSRVYVRVFIGVSCNTPYYENPN